MKNLDLNGLGVQEMNAEEMRVVDGGIIPLILLGSAAWMIWRAASPGWGWSIDDPNQA